MERIGLESVSGCSGESDNSNVFEKNCIKSTVNVIDRVGDLCPSFFDNGKCDSCTGDCNIDTDCYCSLCCEQKNGSDYLSNVNNVPECEYHAGQKDL